MALITPEHLGRYVASTGDMVGFSGHVGGKLNENERLRCLLHSWLRPCA